MNDFINAITNKVNKQDEITVVFKNGTQATYTINILNLIKSEKSVDYIYNNDFEVIYINE